MKKLLTLMIGIAMCMALAPAIAHADDPLQNVTISESGVVSWDPFPHAKVYSVSIIQTHGSAYHAWGGAYTKTTIDIPGELIGYHPDWVVDGATFEITITALTNYAFNGGYRISEDWTGTWTCNIKPESTEVVGDCYDIFAVMAGTLNVRAKANGERIGGLTYGDIIKAKKRNATWVVFDFNGKDGWVKAEHLALYDPKSTLIKPAYYTVTGANTVQVHSAPIKADANRVGGYKEGDKVLVTGKYEAGDYTWYVTEYKGKLAYIISQYLSDGSEASSPKPEASKEDDEPIEKISISIPDEIKDKIAAASAIPYENLANLSDKNIAASKNASVIKVTMFPQEGKTFGKITERNLIPNATSGYIVTKAVLGKDGGLTVTLAKLNCAALDKSDASTFVPLRTKAGKTTKSSIKLTWSKVKNATKYQIYGAKYSGKKLQLLKSTAASSATLKNLKKGTYYKYLVVATNSQGRVLGISKSVYVCTTGGKYTNAKSVKTAAKKSRVALKKGKSFKLKAKAALASASKKAKSCRGMKYETTKKSIATVSSKGVIKAKAKGACYVYAYAQNGTYAKVKVTVK